MWSLVVLCWLEVACVKVLTQHCTCVSSYALQTTGIQEQQQQQQQDAEAAIAFPTFNSQSSSKATAAAAASKSSNSRAQLLQQSSNKQNEEGSSASSSFVRRLAGLSVGSFGSAVTSRITSLLKTQVMRQSPYKQQTCAHDACNVFNFSVQGRGRAPVGCS
jgi:DNA polymerase III gamma/tau subunit